MRRSRGGRSPGYVLIVFLFSFGSCNCNIYEISVKILSFMPDAHIYWTKYGGLGLTNGEASTLHHYAGIQEAFFTRVKEFNN